MAEIPSLPPLPSAAPTATNPAPQAGGESEIFMQGVLQNPVIQQVISGDLPPVYAPPSLFGDRANDAIGWLQTGLPQAGLQLLQAPTSGNLVVFNPQFATAEEIAAADAAGQLDNIADPLQSGAAPASASASPAPGPTPQAAPAPVSAPAAAMDILGGLTAPPAGVQREIATARVNNAEAQPPVKRAMPSQGILNGLTKRAV